MTETQTAAALDNGEDVVETGRKRGTTARNAAAQLIAKLTNLLDEADDLTRGKAVRFIAEEYGQFIDLPS